MHYEVIVIGGGIIGLSTAYYLSKMGVKVAVFEKNYPGYGSTSRCIGGIRQQFSSKSSILVAKESVRLFKKMEKEFGFSIDFKQTGYLMLAYTEEQEKAFKNNVKLQKSLGINVELLSPEDAKKIVPGLNIEGVRIATFSPEDGQGFPFLVLKGFYKGILKNGGEIFIKKGVSKIIEKNGEIIGVETDSGELYESEIVVNSAGPWAGELSKTVGIELPLYPERHEALITARCEYKKVPMLVDYRVDGCYFQQRINGQFIGCYTPHPNVPGKDVSSSMEFHFSMPKRMVRLLPEIKKCQILRHWAGSYTMTPDGNPIVDKTELEGYFVAVGMSGHGFMFAPALGSILADYIINGKFYIDMSDFRYGRDFSSKEILK